MPINTSLSNYIYVEFKKVFVSEASNLAFNLTAITNHTLSFDLCYEAKDVTTTPMGPSVPTIDLVMHRPDAVWRITASNSMVRTTRDDADLWCLGIMNGGLSMKTLIVIGGYQMEDNLLQFDLETTRLGFSSSLLLQRTTCVGFFLLQLQIHNHIQISLSTLLCLYSFIFCFFSFFFKHHFILKQTYTFLYPNLLTLITLTELL